MITSLSMNTIVLVCYDVNSDKFVTIKNGVDSYRFFMTKLPAKNEFEEAWLHDMCKIICNSDTTPIEFYSEKLLNSFCFKCYGIIINNGIDSNERYTMLSLKELSKIDEGVYNHSLFDIAMKFLNSNFRF